MSLPPVPLVGQPRRPTPVPSTHQGPPPAILEPVTFPAPIPGIIDYGSVNILAGASGVGKTCLTASLLVHFRDGTPIFGTAINQPTYVGYIGADRSWSSTKYWFEKVGYGDIPHYTLPDDREFNISRLRSKINLIPILDESIGKLQPKPGGVVCLDPFALFVANLNDYHVCAVACLDMRRLCQKYQITLIALGHAAKQKADRKERYQRLQDRINGSTAQLGYGDTQMYLAAPEEIGQKHYTFLWHPHTAPAQEFQLGRTSDGLFVDYAFSTQAEEENQVFACVPADGSEIALKTLLGLCSNVSRATVFRRLTQLVDDGIVTKAGEGLYKRTRVN